MALVFDVILLTEPAPGDSLATGGNDMSALAPPPARLDRGRVRIHLQPQTSNVTGGKLVGGFDQAVELALTQLEVTLLALALSLVVALPLGLYLGHRGKGELLAVGFGNAGRAIPELALIALMAASIGVGMVNLTIALAVLGIPPILTNAFVGVRQVDRATVEAARGMGMTELGVLLKVELPLAIPTIFSGIRGATIAIVARRRSRPSPASTRSATTSSTKTSTARTGCSPARSSSPCWRWRSSSASPCCNVCSLRKG